MSTQSELLQLVLSSESPITADDAGSKVGVSGKTARRRLRDLYRAGLVDRERPNHQSSFSYLPLGKQTEKIEKTLPEPDSLDLPGEGAVALAIQATRSTWKKPRLNPYETVDCPHCPHQVTFKPWHADWKFCPSCGWIVHRGE